jgi:hypothetical protein
MSIKPLNERLDELAGQGEVQPKPVVEMPTKGAGINLQDVQPLDFEPSDIDESQSIQVAGKFTPFENIAKMFTKETKGLANKGKDAVDEVVPPEIIKPATTDVPLKVPKAKGIEQTTSIQKFEEALPFAKTEGVPPDLLQNLNRIEGSDDLKRVVDAINRASGIEVERVTFEQLQKLAVERGFGTSFIREMDELKAMYGDLPVDYMRFRFAAHNNVSQFIETMQKSALDPNNQELKAELVYRINLQNAIQEAGISVRTKAAQTTSAGNIIIPAPDSDEMKRLLADPKVDEGLKDLMGAMDNLLETSSKEGLLNKVSKVGLLRDLWDLTYKNGLLSATGTHLINLSSSVTFMASTLATRQLAGIAGSIKRGFGLQAEVEMGEAAAALAAVTHTWRDALRLGWVALKTGTTREMREGQDVLSDAGVKFEVQSGKFNARDYGPPNGYFKNLLSMGGLGIEDESYYKAINGWATFVSLLGNRPIMAMDEVTKFLGYRAELYTQAYRAAEQAKRQASLDGKVGDEIEEIGLKAMSDIFVNTPKTIDDTATDFSHMLTFSRKLTGASKAIQELAQESLIGRINLPFVKTPIWATSETMQNSLIAPLSSQWRKDMAEGGAKRELAMAKWGMGSGVMIGVGSYVADGRITGGGPSNQNLRSVYLASGWRPYSFVFSDGEWDQEFVSFLGKMRMDPSVGKDGKLYVPFRGLDPIAGSLAMVADAVEYARYEDDQDLVAQVILGGVWGLYNYVGQQPWLTALSSVTGAFSSTIENPKASFKAAIESILTGGATYALEGSPAGIFSSARGMVARIVDPTARDVAADPNEDMITKAAHKAINKYRSKTPGLSEDLPERYDMFGELENRADPSNPGLSSLSGIRYQESKQRTSDKIIISLGLPIQKPKRIIDVGDVKVKITPEEYQYWLSRIGKVSIDGEGVQKAIVIAANAPGFNVLGKNEKQETIKEVYAQYVSLAKEDLLERFPAISIRAQEAEAKLPIYGVPK